MNANQLLFQPLSNQKSVVRKLNLVKAVNKLVKNAVDNLAKETELIGSLIHLDLKLFAITKLEIDKHVDNNKHKYFEELMDAFQPGLTTSVTSLLRKECDESLLINYGVEPRPKDQVKLFQKQRTLAKHIEYIKKNKNSRGDHVELQAKYNQLVEYLGLEKTYGLDLDISHIENEFNQRVIYLGVDKEADLYSMLFAKSNDIKKTYKGLFIFYYRYLKFK